MSNLSREIYQNGINSSFAYTTYGSTITNDKIKKLSSIVSIIDTTPAATNFASTDVNTTASTITIASHGFLTGLVGQFTTTGTLPTPLALATDYYIIVVDANTIQVAASLADAIAGTFIPLTAQGTGTDTFTATSLSSTLRFEASNDNILWVAIPGVTSSVTGSADEIYNIVDPAYYYLRLAMIITSGQVTAKSETIGYSENG